MKELAISIIVSFIVAAASAQDAFIDCVKNTFLRADSISKLGKNPFEEWKNCVLDKPMPDFTGITISGDTIEMNKLKGKIVVINFWFIGCHPCIAELPGLNRLVEEYKKKDIVFLAITWEKTRQIQKDFFPKYTLNFVIIPDAMKIIEKVAGSGYPTTYIINRRGIIKEAWNGGSTDEKAGKEYYGKAKPVIDGLLKLDSE